VEQLFVLGQLPLKAHVGEDDWAPFAGEGESRLEGHVFLLHEVGDDGTSAPRHTRVAVD